MSILRQFNFLGQERIDVSHFRSLESSIAADVDVLAGRSLAASKPLVVRGFNIAMAGAIGALATTLQVVVADGIFFNINATESGTFFWVPSTRAPETLNSTNPNVTGSFTANQTNYIGVDLIRSADVTTSDLAKFLDAGTLLEISKNVPLGRTLNYRFVISTSAFSTQSNICPIAQVVTNASNIVTSVVDARNLMYRLGSGGDFPNRRNAFTFPGGRNEDTVSDFFAGGDKANQGFKDWADMVMTRIWEIGGGERWYGPTADRNVKMTQNPATVFASSGDNFEFVGGNLHWQGLRIDFDNSNNPGTFSNDIANQTTNNPGQTDLAVGQCIYVDIDRTQTLTGGSALVAVKGTLQTLGTPVIPGSRFIIAWRDSNGVFTRDNRFAVNTAFAPATTTSLGAVQLSYAAGTPATPTVAPLDANGSISNTATGGNSFGFSGTGFGTGPGIRGTGGATSGPGGLFTGGGPNGIGATFQGTGTGAGLTSTGGVTNALGGSFLGGGTTGTGLQATGATNTATNSTGGLGASIIAGANGPQPGGNAAGAIGAIALTTTGGTGNNGGSGSGGTGGIGGSGISSAGGAGGQAFTGAGAAGNGGASITGTGGAGGLGNTGSPGGTGGPGCSFTGGIGGSNSVNSGFPGGVGGLFQGGAGGGTSAGAGGHGIQSTGGTGTGAVHGAGGLFTGGGTTGVGIIGIGAGGSLVGQAGQGGLFIGGTNASGIQATGTGTGVGALIAGGGGIGSFTVPAITSQGYISLTGTNPASTQAFTNSATGKNIAKALLKISTNPVTILDGFNITSVSASVSNLTINFASNFANAHYMPTMMTSQLAISANVLSQTVGTLVLQFYNTSTGVAVDITTLASFNIFVTVHGAQ